MPLRAKCITKRAAGAPDMLPSQDRFQNMHECHKSMSSMDGGWYIWTYCNEYSQFGNDVAILAEVLKVCMYNQEYHIVSTLEYHID